MRRWGRLWGWRGLWGAGGESISGVRLEKFSVVSDLAFTLEGGCLECQHGEGAEASASCFACRVTR